MYTPVIVHHGDEQADLIHVFWGNVKDDGLVVDGIECVLLNGGFFLLQSPSVTKQGHFDVWIWAEGREQVKQMSSDSICSCRPATPHPLLFHSRIQQVVNIIKSPCTYVAHLSRRTLCTR